jgi:hypothetical protein
LLASSSSIISSSSSYDPSHMHRVPFFVPRSPVGSYQSFPHSCLTYMVECFEQFNSSVALEHIPKDVDEKMQLQLETKGYGLLENFVPRSLILGLQNRASMPLITLALHIYTYIHTYIHTYIST